MEQTQFWLNSDYTVTEHLLYNEVVTLVSNWNLIEQHSLNAQINQSSP